MWWMAIHICHRSSQHESSHPPISTCPSYYLLSKQMHMYINQPLCVCMMHLLQWTTTSVHHVFYKKCGISKQRRCVLYSWQKNHNCLGPVTYSFNGEYNFWSGHDMFKSSLTAHSLPRVKRLAHIYQMAASIILPFSKYGILITGCLKSHDVAHKQQSVHRELLFLCDSLCPYKCNCFLLYVK